MVSPRIEVKFADLIVEIDFSEEFEDIKIKRFLNIKRMKEIRVGREVRRIRLELLWGETLMAQLWACLLDIPQEDTFNLRGLFSMDQEEEKADLTYAKEWISGHEDLWGQFPATFATLEELPQNSLDDYPFNEVLERVHELGAHRPRTEEERRKEEEERLWDAEFLEHWWLP